MLMSPATACGLRFRSCSTGFGGGLIGDAVADPFRLTTSPLVILPPTVTRFSFRSPSQYGPIGPLGFGSGVLGVVPTGSEEVACRAVGLGGRIFIEFIVFAEILLSLGKREALHPVTGLNQRAVFDADHRLTRPMPSDRPTRVGSPWMRRSKGGHGINPDQFNELPDWEETPFLPTAALGGTRLPRLPAEAVCGRDSFSGRAREDVLVVRE